MLLNSKKSLTMPTFICFSQMTKRDLVVASTRHHLACLLKYYPRRQCAPSLSNRDFFCILQIYLHYLLSYILKFLICIHAGNHRVPPRVLAPNSAGAISRSQLESYTTLITMKPKEKITFNYQNYDTHPLSMSPASTPVVGW